MSTPENERNNNCKFEYNHALFDSMTSFVDSVWHIDLRDEKVYVLSDYIGDNFAGKIFPLDFFRELIIRNSSTDDAKDTINYFTKEFLSGLKETFLYESCFIKGDQEHHISCNMTPDFDEQGNVKEVFVSMKDIQSQVDREAEHRRVRAELDRYLASPTLGVFQFWKESREIFYANNTALKILGYESLEQLKGDFFNGVVGTVHPSDVETVHAALDSLVVEKDTGEFDCTIVHSDGKELACNSFICQISDEQGNAVIQCNLLDVTEVHNSLRLYKEATDILAGAQMGLWYFVLDDGDPRFHMDDNTAQLVSAGEELTPEEAYNYWYERVDEEYKPQVLSAVVKMRAGVPAEVAYPYHHPTRGTITVRCGGVADPKYPGPGQIIKGYHQDITDYNNRILKQMEISDAIQKHFEAVFEVDMNDASVRVLSDSQNSFKSFVTDGINIDKAFAPIRYAICSHSKKSFDEITNIEKIKEKLSKQSSITVEIESITMGWIRVKVIPSSISKDGEIEKVIELLENIEAIKKQERKAQKQLDEFQAKERRERDILSSLSDIYENVHVFDLAKHSLEEIKSTDIVHDYIASQQGSGVQSILWGLTQRSICEEHCEDVQKFCRLADLTERMRGKKTISVETMTATNEWVRLSFIRIGDKEEKLTKVILVAQNIDEDRRREERYRVMSHTDELTGLYNRHAFEEYVRRINSDGLGDDLWLLVVDINGLKETNDSKGHVAGDELIQGTAECLMRVFSSRGRVFRMGGDEFIVMLRCGWGEMDEMSAALKEVKINWRGNLNEGVSFSTGIVCSSEIEDCTVALMEQEADKRMYADKREYHSKHNRREE